MLYALKTVNFQFNDAQLCLYACIQPSPPPLSPPNFPAPPTAIPCHAVPLVCMYVLLLDPSLLLTFDIAFLLLWENNAQCVGIMHGIHGTLVSGLHC